MYKDLKTSDPSVNVHITYNSKASGKTTLHGYAIKSSTGVRVDGAKTLARTASYDVFRKKHFAVPSELCN